MYSRVYRRQIRLLFKGEEYNLVLEIKKVRHNAYADTRTYKATYSHYH